MTALDLGPTKPGLLAIGAHTKGETMRGKHARAAANRRTAAAAEATEATYRERVVKLTQERDAARAECDATKVAWQKEVRILRAQLAEGTSPRVEALTREVERIREERDQLKSKQREARKLYDAVYQRIFAHFAREHDLSPAEATDAIVAQIYAFAQHVTTDREKALVEALGVDAMLAIRKARGQ